MEEEAGKSTEISNRQKAVDLQSRKANKKNIIFVIIILILLVVISVILFRYIFMGGSDYEKGADFIKDKKFTEALYYFQKVDPDDKNFNNAQSKINYINGLLAFNDGKKPEAIVFLSKVSTDDEYYHDAMLMLEKLNEASIGNDLQSQIDELRNKKDTVFIKKEYTKNQKKEKDPVDPIKQADMELSRKFVSDAANSISRFESHYQSAKTAPLSTKSDYLKNLESVNKEFISYKYSAQNKDAGVVELKRLTGEWMSKRIAYIRQMISEKSVNESEISRSLREDGDRLYTAMMGQMSKVKKGI